MNISEFVSNLPDRRQEFKIRHLSAGIIFITVSAVICGAEDWDDIGYSGHLQGILFQEMPPSSRRESFS
ncbi:Transposase [Bacteroidales bacterium Barb6XT]|nr:Transposase [Bacteroidales bacterium Barb6XT]